MHVTWLSDIGSTIEEWPDLKHCMLKEEEEKETYYFHIFQSGDLILQEKLHGDPSWNVLIQMAMTLKIPIYFLLVKSKCVLDSQFWFGSSCINCT